MLIAVGAILKWAVTAHVSGLTLQTAGTVLFVLGIIGLIISLLYTFVWARQNRTTTHLYVRPARRASLRFSSRSPASAERAGKVGGVHADHQQRH